MSKQDIVVSGLRVHLHQQGFAWSFGGVLLYGKLRLPFCFHQRRTPARPCVLPVESQRIRRLSPRIIYFMHHQTPPVYPVTENKTNKEVQTCTDSFIFSRSLLRKKKP